MKLSLDYHDVAEEVRLALDSGNVKRMSAASAELYNTMAREYDELLGLQKKFTIDGDVDAIREVAVLISDLVDDMNYRAEEGARLKWLEINNQTNTREGQ